MCPKTITYPKIFSERNNTAKSNLHMPQLAQLAQIKMPTIG